MGLKWVQTAKTSPLKISKKLFLRWQIFFKQVKTPAIKKVLPEILILRKKNVFSNQNYFAIKKNLDKFSCNIENKTVFLKQQSIYSPKFSFLAL